MAIHYDAKLKRFRDDSGKLVSRERAMRSSIARREFEAAQRKVSRAKPKPKAPPKPPSKPRAAPPKPTPKAKPAKPKKAPAKKVPRIPPWEREGIVREYPAPDEWFPEIDFYDYEDLEEDWGDFDIEETDS